MLETTLATLRSLLTNDGTAPQQGEDESITPDRFQGVVGNPPYQYESGNGAIAIYHHVMQDAQNFSELLSMVYPARWMNTGRGDGITDFRRRELDSRHYRRFIVDPSTSGVFPDAHIKGGVCFFLWEKQDNNGTLSYTHGDSTDIRETLIAGMPVMVSKPLFLKIARKVGTQNYLNVAARNFYGKAFESDKKIEQLASRRHDNDPGVRIFYSKSIGGVHETIIPSDTVDKPVSGWKVLVSRTADPNKARTLLPRQNRVLLAAPGEIPSGSFLIAGIFDTFDEARNCIRYLKTDLATFLFGVVVPTQNTYSKSYALVPDVDFSTGVITDRPEVVPLDFSKPESLDKQLADIYGLSEDEQAIIRDNLRPWRDKLDIHADGKY